MATKCKILFNDKIKILERKDQISLIKDNQNFRGFSFYAMAITSPSLLLHCTEANIALAKKNYYFFSYFGDKIIAETLLFVKQNYKEKSIDYSIFSTAGETPPEYQLGDISLSKIE